MNASTRPLEVLFLTNFSNLCFQAIPALAQMSDDIDMRLTILHASGDSADVRPMEENLRNFFPEADHFSRCRRVLERGRPLEAVRRLRAEQPVDLVVAPAGDPLGMPRIGHSSLRSGLVRDLGVPLWTNGPSTQPKRLVRAVRNVACVMQDGSPGRAHLRMAAQYAAAVNARLHVVRTVDALFDEGKLLMLAFDYPFERVDAEHALQNELADTGLVPELHLASPRRLGDVLSRIDADIVFLDAARWTGFRWLRRRMHGMLDRLPCPAVCIDSAGREQVWPLRRSSRPESAELLRLPAATSSTMDAIEGELAAAAGAMGRTAR